MSEALSRMAWPMHEIDEADDGRLLRHRLDVVVRELALVLVKISRR
jgi:hypothetical protein